MNIYVGNIPFAATEAGLEELFASYGEVVSVLIVVDRATGQSRGFAFVRMGSREAGESALAALNGHEWMGRNITCDEARGRDSTSPPRSGPSTPPPRHQSGTEQSEPGEPGESSRAQSSSERRRPTAGKRTDSDKRGRDGERSNERKKSMPPQRERRANNRDWSRYIDEDDDE